MPISNTRNRVRVEHDSTVRGSPTSELKDPRGDTVSPCGANMAASRSFVVVLPLEPVIPMTSVSGRRRMT